MPFNLDAPVVSLLGVVCALDAMLALAVRRWFALGRFDQRVPAVRRFLQQIGWSGAIACELFVFLVWRVAVDFSDFASLAPAYRTASLVEIFVQLSRCALLCVAIAFVWRWSRTRTYRPLILAVAGFATLVIFVEVGGNAMQFLETYFHCARHVWCK